MSEHPVVAGYRGLDSADAVGLGALLARALDVLRRFTAIPVAILFVVRVCLGLGALLAVTVAWFARSAHRTPSGRAV